MEMIKGAELGFEHKMPVLSLKYHQLHALWLLLHRPHAMAALFCYLPS